MKTHQPGFDVRQLGLGTYRWTTPHGLGRLVTTAGTRRFEPIRTKNGVIGEIYYSDGPAPPAETRRPHRVPTNPSQPRE